jgi:DNA-binding transcriptional LysR family regulator
MQTPEDLNDLRLVAAIYQTGSLSGAARKLDVNHATVFRRLAAIETRLGVRLFERENGRYAATPAGEELASVGASIDNLAAAAILKVAGQDLRPSGVVRITTTDSVAQFLLPPALLACQSAYPEIRLEVVVSNELHNLSKRDADIAIRPTSKPPEHLVGKRLSALEFGVYASKAYLRKHKHQSWPQHQWIAFESAQSQRQLLDKLGVGDPALSASTFPTACAACEAGLGLAILPSFVGNQRSKLERLDIPTAEFGSEMWLLAHPDMVRTARVQAIFQTLLQQLRTA